MDCKLWLACVSDPDLNLVPRAFAMNHSEGPGNEVVQTLGVISECQVGARPEGADRAGNCYLLFNTQISMI